MKKTYLLLLLIGCMVGLQAQQNDPDHWRYFKSMETITCHAETVNTVWLGTKNGLVLIDKNTFEQELYTYENSNLPSNTIEAIEFDIDGNAWIGTYDYILAMRDGDDWVNLDIPVDDDVLGGSQPLLFDFEITADGSFWLATNNGMWHYQNGSWEVYNSQAGNLPEAFNPDIFWEVEEDENNRLFFAGHHLFMKEGSDIVNLSDDSPEIFFYDDAHAVTRNGKTVITDNIFFIASFEGAGSSVASFANSDFPINGSFVMSVDSEANLFVLFNNGEKYLLEDLEWTAQESPLASEFFFTGSGFGLHNKYYFIDADNNDWASQYVELFYVNNNEVQEITISEIPLFTNTYKRITTASEGTTYILDVIQNHLVTYRADTGWDEIAVPDSVQGVKLFVYEMATDTEDNLWLSSNVGLMQYDGANWTAMTTANSDFPFPAAGYFSIAENGSLYVMGFSDLGWYDGQDWTVLTAANSGLLDGQTKNLLATSNGELWITREHTVQHFDGQVWTNYNAQNADLPEYIGIHNMIEASNGYIWMAAGSQGVSCFDGSEWKTYSVGAGIYTAQQVAEGTDGLIWVATYQDAGVFDGADWSFLNMDNSLLNDNVIHQIWASSDGSIWMNGFNQGLNVYHKEGFSPPVSSHETLENTIRLFPNPAHTRVYFDESFAAANQAYALYAVDGQLVQSGVLNTNYLDVSQLKNGIYSLQILLDDFVKNTRFVIQK